MDETRRSDTEYSASEGGVLKLAEPGVVYTKAWVVDLVLDVAGYSPDSNLVDATAIEPSCGSGEFLAAMVRRLSASCRRQGRPLRDCESSLLAFDLSSEAVEKSRERVEAALVGCGWGEGESRSMARRWVRRADFLLDPELDMASLGGGVGFVVGNPPYVRLEFADQPIMEVYRKRYATMAGRADLYVGFYERALSVLSPGGVCAFICADRWMLNQYGSRLRKLITSGGYSVEAVFEMHRADAFHSEVLAYPAITSIRRCERQGRVLVAKLDRASEDSASELGGVARSIRIGETAGNGGMVSGGKYVVVDEWFEGAGPWPSASPERLKLLKKLEVEFPTLEDEATGTKVSIGVATGSDKVFLTKDSNLVEEDRLLPMAMAKDTMTGSLRWGGTYLVNPWERDGSLVDLEKYPKLRRYFERNERILSERHVAKKNPARWHKTIDKVDHAVTVRPKLLVPDIKGYAHPVLDEGGFHPHHNLYHVTSDGWDLRVLGGILLSRVSQFFIECYAVRMHNGYLRFQAQYLRRIRVPSPGDIRPDQAEAMRRAFENRDVDAATEIAMDLYGIEAVPD